MTPITGLITVDSLIEGEYDVFWNALSHLVLPASILGYLSLAYVARMTRSFMLGQLKQEYVLATLAKGLSPFRVVWVHALGNVWVPLVTVVALTFGSLLEGAVLTETVFAWPGLGLYMKNSLFNADLNAVLGGTMLVGVGLHRPQPALRPALSAGRSARAGVGDERDRRLARPGSLDPAPAVARQARLGALVPRLARVPPQRPGDDRACRSCWRWSLMALARPA